MYQADIGGMRYRFDDLKTLMGRASPLRSGDVLAGVAAGSMQERAAAQYALGDVPLRSFVASEAIIPYEQDEITRLIVDSHDAQAFAPIAHLTVGEFRDWLLSDACDAQALQGIAPGVTPEMAAAVSKLMRVQDLVVVSAKCQVVTRCRTTMGLPGRFGTRLQPNHPTDDPRGIAASILDGLLLGAGDAMIGVNPASDSPQRVTELLHLLDDVRTKLEIPTQTCVLTHVTTTLGLIASGAPVDLVFQSIAGTEAANASFGIRLKDLHEAHQAARALGRTPPGAQLMYFETGQGSALSSNAHHGADQQTLEARAYGLARHFDPFLVNSVVGFIGPEYLLNGKQITRAGLEDMFCGKLLGVPMGCDICYTHHADADQDDQDTLFALMIAGGIAFVMGVPGGDDVMLGYQSTSFHDALAMRQLFKCRPAPEFEQWLQRHGIQDEDARIRRTQIPAHVVHALLGS